MRTIHSHAIYLVENNDALIQEGVLRNMIIYGPISTFRIWLEKFLTGQDVIGKFEKLNNILSQIFDELDTLDTRFTKKYINKIEFDNLLNDAIFNCIYNAEYNNKEKASDPGKCVVEYFLNINLNMLSQVFYETIILMIDYGMDVNNIRNIDDFKKLMLDKDHKLYTLIYLINQYSDTLLEFLSSKKFNKYFTFSEIKKAIIDSTYRIDKVNQINTHLLKQSQILKKDSNKQVNFTV